MLNKKLPSLREKQVGKCQEGLQTPQASSPQVHMHTQVKGVQDARCPAPLRFTKPFLGPPWLLPAPDQLPVPTWTILASSALGARPPHDPTAHPYTCLPPSTHTCLIYPTDSTLAPCPCPGDGSHALQSLLAQPLTALSHGTSGGPADNPQVPTAPTLSRNKSPAFPPQRPCPARHPRQGWRAHPRLLSGLYGTLRRPSTSDSISHSPCSGCFPPTPSGALPGPQAAISAHPPLSPATPRQTPRGDSEELFMSLHCKPPGAGGPARWRDRSLGTGPAGFLPVCLPPLLPYQTLGF